MAKAPVPQNLPCMGECGGRMIPIKEFYLNHNQYHLEYNFGRMHYCKSCTKSIGNKIMGEYWNISRNQKDKCAYHLGMISICNVFHMPYIPNMVDMLYEEYGLSSKDRQTIDYIYEYGKILKNEDINKDYWNNLNGNTYLSYDLFKQGNNNQARLTTDGDMELLNYLEKTWGIQDSLNDYMFLEEQFNTYSDGETLTPAMSNTLRYLCQAELSVKQLKNNKAEQKDIKDAEKRVMDYYKSLKLDEFKFNKSKSVAEKLIEDWAYIEETKDPLDWVDENLEDICKFREDTAEIYRCLANKIVGSKDYPNINFEDINVTKK